MEAPCCVVLPGDNPCGRPATHGVELVFVYDELPNMGIILNVCGSPRCLTIVAGLVAKMAEADARPKRASIIEEWFNGN